MAVALTLRGGRGVALAAAPLVLLVLLPVVRLLPADGLGLALRLGVALGVFLVPGALLLAVVGWPANVGVAAAGSLALSLLAAFLAYTLTFAAEGTLALVFVVLVLVAAGSLVPAVRAAPVSPERGDLLAAGAVLLVFLLVGALAWWASGSARGDALFHLARVRKLDEFPVLYSVRTLNEFRDGGLHPGYAFPLWHGALAVVARLAAVDAAEVVRYLPALLAPLAGLVAYGAGAALFRSWAGGVAAALAQAAQLGFGRDGVGSFGLLTLPATAARVLLVPAFLALAFALLRAEGWSLAVPLGAAGLALTLVHPTYALFLCLPLGAFLVARALLVAGDRRTPVRLSAALGALLAPFVAYTIWILPVLNSTVTITASDADRRRDFAHYAGQLTGSVDLYRLAADFVARGGPAVVAGLLAVPLALLARRRLWAALVLGGTVAVLLLVELPWVFTAFSDAVSPSQGRRLAAFLPLPFALAGAASLAARLGPAGVAAAGAAGVAVELLYPGEFTYRLGEGGPGWAVWIALGGGAAALAVGAALRRRHHAAPERPVWTAAVAAAFVLPIAVGGLADVSRNRAPDPYALTPGLVRELRSLEPRKVVLSNLETSYRVAAYAPLNVAAAPPAHVARTKLNKPYVRRAAVIAFFFRPGVKESTRARILEDYRVDYVLVDTTRRYPEELVGRLEQVYADGRYELYAFEQPPLRAPPRDTDPHGGA